MIFSLQSWFRGPAWKLLKSYGLQAGSEIDIPVHGIIYGTFQVEICWPRQMVFAFVETVYGISISGSPTMIANRFYTTDLAASFNPYVLLVCFASLVAGYVFHSFLI